MTCREFSEFLSDYLASELPAEARQVFQQHFDECPTCIDYVKSFESTIRLGQCVCTHPDDPVPQDVPEDLVKAILAGRKKLK